ncbi:hypothetical protein BGZ60DRAFT_20797 [Tricladium varicosporioides]|nr:hypothetical protein BGZ60DRAFT_20797 [Hymenoscyphus varicosporioides]
MLQPSELASTLEVLWGKIEQDRSFSFFILTTLRFSKGDTVAVLMPNALLR